jgi:hypothetical protein
MTHVLVLQTTTCFLVRPYHLHLKEMFSSVTQYSGNDFAEFMSLAHIPIREAEGFNDLGQLVNNADDVQGQHVHFMAAVKYVSTRQPSFDGCPSQ